MKSLAIIDQHESKEREAHDRYAWQHPRQRPRAADAGRRACPACRPHGAAALLSAATAVLSAASAPAASGRRSDRREEVARRTHVPARLLRCAVACAIGLGGFGIWQATAGGNDSGSSSSATQLGSQNSGSINATDAESDQTLAEAVAQKALPSVAAIDVYTNQSNAGACTVLGPATDLKPAR